MHIPANSAPLPAKPAPASFDNDTVGHTFTSQAAGAEFLRSPRKFNLRGGEANRIWTPVTRPFGTNLKELLDDVVAEDVHHELVGGLQDLAEDELALG